MGKLFANHKADKESISKMYEELIQLRDKGTIQLKMSQGLE